MVSQPQDQLYALLLLFKECPSLLIRHVDTPLRDFQQVKWRENSGQASLQLGLWSGIPSFTQSKASIARSTWTSPSPIRSKLWTQKCQKWENYQQICWVPTFCQDAAGESKGIGVPDRLTRLRKCFPKRLKWNSMSKRIALVSHCSGCWICVYYHATV